MTGHVADNVFLSIKDYSIFEATFFRISTLNPLRITKSKYSR